MDATQRHATLALEQASGCAGNIDVVSLESFAVGDLLSLQQWRSSAQIRYEFSTLVAVDARVASDLLLELLEAGAFPDEPPFAT